jgi:hypothetical protein
MFSGMPDFGQPTGPTWVVLPLKEGAQIRPITKQNGSLYSKVSDGALEAGWMLVFFSSPGDGRDNDIPVLVTFSGNPESIMASGLSERTGAEGGLKLSYDKRQLRMFTLMPLYGASELEKQTVMDWFKSGKLPEDVIRRAEFWYLASLKLPVQMEEKFKVDEKARLVNVSNKFSYTENMSEWTHAPILLSPISPFLALSGRFLPFGNPKLQDMDMPLKMGPYCAAVGAELSYTLKIPDLSVEFAVSDIDKLNSDKSCGEYLKQLNDGRSLRIMEDRVKAQLRKETPMPHVAALNGFMQMYPYLNPENKRRFLETVRVAYDGIIFNHALRGKMYPEKYAYKMSNYRYLDLTTPYGCPEPFWNIGQVLAALGDYSYYTGDYGYYQREWPFIKEMAGIIWIGGFYHYRYDGGMTLGAVLEGLIRAAKKAGDQAFYEQALFTYTQYAHTMAGFYQLGEWAKKNRLWDRTGNSVELLGGDVQVFTRMSSFFNFATCKAFKMCGFDISYGNYDLLRHFANEEVLHIEQELLPRYRSDWWQLQDWEDPACVARRFGVRALVVRESPERLQEYIRLLMAQDSFKKSNATSDALVNYLKRVQQKD